jgi:hypothetical protein
VATGLLAVAAAGCGGGEPLAPEVPGPPAEVKVPQSAQSPGDVAAANGQGSASGTATPTPTGSGTSGTSGATATPTPTVAGTDQGGGAAAPDATADGPTNDTPPPDGSNAQQFEDFCAQNPGAC